MSAWGARAGIVLSLFLSYGAMGQSVFDPSLKVQSYAGGFDAPTGAVFLNDRGDLNRNECKRNFQISTVPSASGAILRLNANGSRIRRGCIGSRSRRS